MKFLQEFENYLVKEKKASRSTIRAYMGDLNEFGAYMETERGKLIEDAGNADVAAFLMKLKAEGKSGSTVNRKLASIRAYFACLRENGLSASNPTEGIKAPKQPRKEPEFLTVEEVNAILDMPGKDPKGMRDKALLEIMYATGMKAGEAAALNREDVDLRIGFVVCSSETGKRRMIPLGKPARTAVDKYLSESRAKLLKEEEDCGALFLNYMGERMTRQGIWKVLKYYGEKAGLEKDINPLILRNSFAAHMIQNGADLRSLQELLGHEDINATKVFLELSKNRIMDVYDKAFPRAK